MELRQATIELESVKSNSMASRGMMIMAEGSCRNIEKEVEAIKVMVASEEDALDVAQALRFEEEP